MKKKKRKNINKKKGKLNSKLSNKISFIQYNNISLNKNTIINNINNNIVINKNHNNLNNNYKNNKNFFISDFSIPRKFSSSNITLKNDSQPSYLVFSENRVKENTMFMNFNGDLDINIQEYLSTEIDDMDYNEVIKKDKRTFKEYYFEKLKSNQIIFNIILENEPLKPKTMKMILFILNIILYFFINGLFFNEDYISEVFHSNKKENFFTFATRSIERFLYTTLVGVIINYMIECFFVDEKIIKKILKRDKENLFNVQSEIARIEKNIRKRYNSFIVISFVINSFILYYNCCFNIIYSHSRIEWIKSSFMIVIIMQILSILVSLLETIIRYIGIKCKSQKIYRISLFLS